MVDLAESTWVVYAVVAMALFSVGNLMLKLAVDSIDFSRIKLESLAPLLLVIVAGGVVLYAGFFGKAGLQSEALKYVAVFVVVAVLGFLALVESLKSGKVSVVNAILALSVVFVTALAAIFLGEKVSLKETAAMALAVASIFLLAS